MKTAIFDWKRTLYDPERLTLIDGTISILKFLKSNKIKLVLIGKGGDDMIREVKRLKLMSFFSHIIFVGDKKTTSAFKPFITKDPRDTLIVGDRVRAEIELGISLGTKTAWIQQGTFANELPKSKKQKPTYVFPSLKNLLIFLQKQINGVDVNKTLAILTDDMSDVVSILKKVGGIITDSHFVYTSGKHGSVYINKDAIYPHTKETSQIGKLFAERFKRKAVDVVVAPAVGGTILSQWTAYHLSKLKGKEVLSAYTEKDKGTLASAAESEQVFRRGYDKLIKGKKILVIEDLTTTGLSVKKVVRTVKKAGGKVVGVAVMVNRNPKGVNAKFMGVPFTALAVLKAEAFDEKKCELCKKNVPINTAVGHGKKYLEIKKKKS